MRVTEKTAKHCLRKARAIAARNGDQIAIVAKRLFVVSGTVEP